MIIRYCIRTSHNSKKNAEALKNKLISITPANTTVDIILDDKSITQAFFRHASKIINEPFDYIVLLDDSALVNDNIHSNLLHSNDMQATNVGLIHLSMPTSATLFSSDTLYDLEERVYFRTNVVYDSRALAISKKLLLRMRPKELLTKNIFSLAHFITKNIKEYGFNHTIHYPALVATIPSNVFLDEYDFEIVDDLFSKNWNRLRKDSEHVRLVFLEKNYHLHDKAGFLDDFEVKSDEHDNSLDIAAMPRVNTSGKEVDKSVVYFLDLGSTYTWNIFVQNLSEIVSIEIVRSLEAAVNLMQKGHSIFANGFHNRFIEIVQKHPKLLNCFWHSSLSGVDVMQERPVFLSFLEAISKDQVRGFFLNPHEALVPNAKRFWLPYSIPDEASLIDNPKCDFAIVASSPYSVGCKNVLATLIYLLYHDYSFVIPKWLADDYKIEALKKAYLSASRIEIFDTHSIPIEKEYYQMASFYLMTSLTDTMPYSCVESISCGVPFIITKGVGWASYFDGDEFVLDSMHQLDSFFKGVRDEEGLRAKIYDKQLNVMRKISSTNKRMTAKLFHNYN